MRQAYYVYIITNRYNKVFYIGITRDIQRRMYEHKYGLIDGFSKKYNLSKLIYYEEYTNVNDAITREKQLKNWHREWKINLAMQLNPELNDLLG